MLPIEPHNFLTRPSDKVRLPDEAVLCQLMFDYFVDNVIKKK